MITHVPQLLKQDATAVPPSPRVEPRVVFISIVGFWAFYFVLNTLRALVEDSAAQMSMLPRRACVALCGMVLVYLLYLVLRRVEGKNIWTLVTTAILASVPVSLLYATLNYVAFYIVKPMDWMEKMQASSHEKYKPWIVVTDLSLTWYFFVVAWAILYVALSYAAKVRHAERSAALYRAEAQTAQLRALRYQINPHFLFNTLNSLSTLILRQRTDEAERMIINLATFFRTSLTGDAAEDVPLAEEIRMQRLYLDIERSRFPERLKVDFDIPPHLASAAVPSFLLQPLVENAIKHGVSRSLRPVTIIIRARATNETLNLIVQDNGDPVLESTPGTGVGLRNVRDRLQARFDGKADLHCTQASEGGFRVEVTMPLVLTKVLAG